MVKNFKMNSKCFNIIWLSLILNIVNTVAMQRFEALDGFSSDTDSKTEYIADPINCKINSDIVYTASNKLFAKNRSKKVLSKLDNLTDYKSKRSKLACCLVDTSFKVILTSFILVAAITGCFLIYKMINGCDQMGASCNQCTDKLENAQELVDLGKQAAETFIKVFKQCPNPEGRTALIEGLMKFYDDCCQKNNL